MTAARSQGRRENRAERRANSHARHQEMLACYDTALVDELTDLGLISGTTRTHILDIMSFQRNPMETQWYPSQRRIAQRAGRTRRTAMRRCKTAMLAGVLLVTRRMARPAGETRREKRNQTNVYELNRPVIARLLGRPDLAIRRSPPSRDQHRDADAAAKYRSQNPLAAKVPPAAADDASAAATEPQATAEEPAQQPAASLGAAVLEELEKHEELGVFAHRSWADRLAVTATRNARGLAATKRAIARVAAEVRDARARVSDRAPKGLLARTVSPEAILERLTRTISCEPILDTDDLAEAAPVPLDKSETRKERARGMEIIRGLGRGPP